MSITTQLLLVAVAACLCLSEGAADGRVARAKQQRPTRGFKNVEMMTARGFGKRGRPSARTEQSYHRRFHPKSSMMVATDFGKRSGNNEPAEEEVMRVSRGFKPHSRALIARGYGKRKISGQRVYGLDNFWETLEGSPERDGQEINDDKTLESIPVDWFVNEMVNNPDFARSVVHKFIDLNLDGQLSSDELLRNVV